MRPEARKLIWDAREAVARIQEFTAGKSLEDYAADALLSSAVERQLEIVGEALHRLSRLDPETAAGIEEISRIVGARGCETSWRMATRPSTTGWYGMS